MLTLEDGWLLNADGLHIHRWFLHVEPFRRDRVGKLLTSSGVAGANDSVEPLLDRLDGHYGLGVLDNLLRRPLDPAVAQALRLGRPPASAAAICGRPLLVIGPDRLIDQECGLVDPDVILNGAPAVDPAIVRAATAALQRTDLDYLVKLAVAVVVTVERPPLPGPDAPITDDPLSTVFVRPTDSGEIYAERLLDAAAREFTRLFIETRSMYIGGRTSPAEQPAGTWYSPEQQREVSGRSLLMEIVAAAARHRFWSRLHQRSPHSATQHRAAGRAAEELAALTHYAEVVYPAAESFEDINTLDLVNTFYPGPRQYEKYRTGLGIGQIA